MSDYGGLNRVLGDIEGNQDIAKTPAKVAVATPAPGIAFGIAAKLTLSIVLLVTIVIVSITAVVLRQLQQVQLTAMQDGGKVLAGQIGRGLLEIVGTITPENRSSTITIEIVPPLNENLKVKDVVYIHVFEDDHKVLYSGGDLAEILTPENTPWYPEELVVRNQTKPEILKTVAKRPLSGLGTFEEILNKAFRFKEEIYDICAPISALKESKKAGEVHLGFSTARGNRELLTTLRNIIAIAIGFMVVAILFSIIFSLFFTRPITRLKNVMVQVGQGDLSQRVPIASRDEVGLLTWNFNRMVDEIAEKERMRDSFGKAVSEEIVEVMMSGDLFLGGEEKSVTMMFSDIRSFTKISGTLTPSGVMEMLNEYFTRMEYVVNRNLGIIDKYVGDAIMAIFGATDSNQDHAENACRCAIEMILELQKLNREREARGQVPLQIGIGINTGTVTAGMLGSQNRMNYTVIGDTVNMASRLCDAGGSHGFAPIVIAEDTYEMVKDLVKVRTGHSVMAKGKSRPVKIYELLGIADRKATLERKMGRVTVVT